ncbi:MAG: 5-formyltetrahydrofolate cyclo-ligase [Deltaproteobacteria bacterium]|nr:5-formyltetrahydrofolate cyclo-ligase [Deltaproteobacteria bacterium]
MEPQAPYGPEALEALKLKARAHLRKSLRALRAQLPPSAREAHARAITDRVLALPPWREARRVALYASLPDEVDTQGLLRDARDRGLYVALPVVDRARERIFLREALGPRGPWALTPGVWGIAEPEEGAPEVDPASLDLVLVPALAADPRGHRLGYGKGHYDRLLPLAGRAVRVAVLFDFQLVAEVPDLAHDATVDWLVTERRVVRGTP